MIGMPSYGGIDPKCQSTVRTAMMDASNRGVLWAGDAAPDKMPYGLARNTIAQACLETDVDGVVWIDSDMILKAESISRLLMHRKRANLDFVSGVYHQRHPHHTPVFFAWNEEKKKYAYADAYPENTCAPSGACGFGFVWTSKAMLKGIAASPLFDGAHGGWFPDRRNVPGGFGEDFSFCYLAMRAGYQLWIDTGIQLGHLGDPKIVTREDFLREQVEHGYVPGQTVPDQEGRETKWGLKE